jgi:hypothetical protein
MSLITKIRKRFKDQKGQSTTEYILILAIVVMIASKMKNKMQTSTENLMGGVDGIMQRQIQDMQSSGN